VSSLAGPDASGVGIEGAFESGSDRARRVDRDETVVVAVMQHVPQRSCDFYPLQLSHVGNATVKAWALWLHFLIEPR
jgi:hypothetical protein